MYKLLEDYLKDKLNWSKLEVQSYNIQGNTCICVYKYYSGHTESTIYDNKEEVNIWDLLEFTYLKLTII
jgi:hypothetical protein